MEEIEVKGRGTLAVMEWIRENNTPCLDCHLFTEKGKPFMIVSSESIHPGLQEKFKKAFEYEGMKRVTIQPFNEPMWYFEIDGSYYFASMY